MKGAFQKTTVSIIMPLMSCWVLICLLPGEMAAQSPQLPGDPFNYANPRLPNFFQSVPDHTPPDNPVTDHGATLGRVLFYDKKLSANNTTACASCHLQEKGFADSLQFSIGFEGGETRRNAMAFANIRYDLPEGFFWDHRAETMEASVLAPIEDSLEMGMNLEALTEKIAALDYYPSLFQSAFGNREVTEERISKALSQFLRAMVSYQSPFDSGMTATNGEFSPPFPNYSQLENDGKFVFRTTQCPECHLAPLISGAGAFNNGLDTTSADRGKFEISGNPGDLHTFKSTGLKNIELTAPYMHDGSLATLEDVVEHYSSGIRAHATLDPRLPVGGFNFSDYQKSALAAFMKTFTDREFISDEKFSDPFPAVTAIAAHESSIPQHPKLYQNYPNPFNPETTIGFWVSDFGFVQLKIYDISGRLVKTLIAGERLPGEYWVLWDGRNNAGIEAASGIYFYQINMENLEITKKMILLR